MKLGEFITKCNAQKINIACKDGSRFAYVGSKSSINLPYLDKLAKKKITEDMNNYIKRLNNLERGVKDRLKECEILEHIEVLVDAKKNYIPFAEREVIEVYHSLVEEDRLFIIVPGTFGGFEYIPPMKPIKAEDMDKKAVENLLTAVLHDLFSELSGYYETLEYGSFRQDSKLNLEYKVKSLEKMVRQDPYGLGYDPEHFIETAKKFGVEKAQERKKRMGYS